MPPPSVPRHLVATGMNPGRAEHACDFVEDGLQEIVCLADSRVKDVVSEILDTSIHPGLGWIPQFGDSLQHAIAVSRDVDLRHDGDEKLFGPAREASNILARIDDAIRLRRTSQERRHRQAMSAPSRQFGKLRITRNIQSPALVVAEMKMETVQLVPS